MKTKLVSLMLLSLVISMTAATAVASACSDQEQRRGGEHFQELQAAVEDGDYANWAILMAENDHPHAAEMLAVINADNFYLLGELMEAHENHDQEAAGEIMDELGLEFPGRRGPRGDAEEGHHRRGDKFMPDMQEKSAE